ncbi:hypothetical protein [Microvirga thermotolerans]|uniref:Uncharacterized protein n=1 Tax=Microvirga thermotolerans TaxID=2651334 RepID=A0A5P9JTD7_9HYPH|nr:hypothetical protein [Microvirga thermotolerans]QFU14730.1 hypothetical protein GDR74_00055 [Microvirga thermotolerans]
MSCSDTILAAVDRWGASTPQRLLHRGLVVSIVCVFSLAASPGGAASKVEEEALASLFLRTCLRHIDDVSQLPSLLASEGGRRVESPAESADSKQGPAEVETWVLGTGGLPTIVHLKRGTRDGRRFALCFARRENTDVFDISVDTITRSVPVRPIRPSKEAFTMRASFMVERSGPLLVEVSAAQGPLVRFTMISATKLLGTTP